jgi:hypothetical protein
MSELAEANRLLSYAWAPRKVPGADPEYARLVRRYQAETAFQVACHQAAAGLGLFVLAVDPLVGIVAYANEESPFALTVGDYSRRAGATETGWVVHGLAFVAVARLCYPQPAHLDTVDRVPRVTVGEVDEYLRRLCDRLDEETAGEQVDPPADQPALERAWRTFNRRREVGRTKDGRAHQQSTRRIVEKALDWLVEQGCLQRVAGKADTYRATPRFRIVVRELTGNAFYTEVLEVSARAQETSGSLPGRAGARRNP